MIPVHRIHELVRLDAITPTEAAELLAMNRRDAQASRLARALDWTLIAVLILLIAIGVATLTACGPATPPPDVDAGVAASPPSMPPPTACLPWPCADAGRL